MTGHHIVGLDLSLTETGIARIRPRGPIPIRLTSVGSSAIRGGTAAAEYYPLTLSRIRGLARKIIDKARDGVEEGDLIVWALEGPAYGTDSGQYHARAGLFWIVYHLIEKLGVVVIIPPASLKRYVTGKGNADKTTMVATLSRIFPQIDILSDNEADALGLALMAARELGSPMEPSVQKVTPGALEGVNWGDYITQRRISNGA